MEENCGYLSNPLSFIDVNVSWWLKHPVISFLSLNMQLWRVGCFAGFAR